MSMYQTAASRGEEMMKTALRARSARYSRKTGRVTLELVNGCTYTFPADLVQDLKGARPGSLARVEVDGAGFNLHWPTLDVDLYIPALVAGVFGTKKWMAENELG